MTHHPSLITSRRCALARERSRQLRVKVVEHLVRPGGRRVEIGLRGSLHLLCGAAPVPPRPFALGTLAGIAPTLLALGLLAALVRRMLLDPGPVLTTVTLGVIVLLALIALRVRLALLRRSFTATTRGHAEDARFG